MTRTTFRLLRSTTLAALGLGIATAPVSAKDIVWARYGDIDSLDPHRATSTLSLQVWSLIYDTLLATDKDGKPVPHLAKSWTASPDGKEYTFTLQDGVACHDGTPLNAEDVKYTVERAFDSANPSVTKASWGPITGVEVVDPLTVKLKLDKPFVALIPVPRRQLLLDHLRFQQGRAGLRHDGGDRLGAVEADLLDQGRQDRAGQERRLQELRQASREQGRARTWTGSSSRRCPSPRRVSPASRRVRSRSPSRRSTTCRR